MTKLFACPFIRCTRELIERVQLAQEGHVELLHRQRQMCALELVLLGWMWSPSFARSVKTETTTAMPKVCADDAGVLSKNICDVDIALKITGRFATVTQQKLNVDTTKVWGTTETALQSVRDLDLNGEQLDVVNKLKSSEIQLRRARRMTNDVADERVRKGITISNAASNESQLDCVFGWTGSNVWFPCGRFFPQTGEFIAESSGCGAVGHG